MTTPGLRWPASSVTAASADTWREDPNRGPLWPPRQGERQGQGRGDRRLLPPATSWCGCQGSGTSMISTRLEASLASVTAWPRPDGPNGTGSCGSSAPSRNRLRSSSLSLVRYRGTDYSVPTFGHCGSRHQLRRRGDSAFLRARDFVFDPLHYLSLLTNALDHVAAGVRRSPPPTWKRGFANPEADTTAAMLRGNRELLPRRCSTAISEALERGVIGFDAVKHLVLCRIEKRPPRLNLLAHPYLAARRGGNLGPARTWGS